MLGLPDGVRACLFDLDGVLTQTAKIHAAAWKKMFDDFLRERAAKGGEPFLPFDPVAEYDEYVDGKPRYDGVRSFLAARGIDLPEGEDSDPPTAETVTGLGNRKNEIVLRMIRDEGVEAYEGSVQAGLPRRANVPHRALIGLNALIADHAQNDLVLAVAESGDRLGSRRVAILALRKVDTARSKERAHAVVARLAVDVLVIFCNRIERQKRLAALRRPLAQKVVEHLLPGSGVDLRSLRQHPIQIEQARPHTVRQTKHRESLQCRGRRRWRRVAGYRTGLHSDAKVPTGLARLRHTSSVAPVRRRWNGCVRVSRKQPTSGELGIAALVSIGIGGMVGGGIFAVLGLTVQVAGAGAYLSFLVGGGVAALTGWSYARLSVLVRSRGGTAAYLDRHFGRG